MSTGNWQKSVARIVIVTVAILAIVIFWVADGIKKSWVNRYRMGMWGSAVSLISAQDSVHEARNTFASETDDLRIGSRQAYYHLKILEADSAHWVASVGDSALSGTCIVSAKTRTDSGGRRSDEDIQNIMAAARCTDPAVTALWTASH